MSNLPCDNRPMKIIKQTSLSTHQPQPLTNPDVARTVFEVLDRLDSDSRRKPPSLLTVFRLYCLRHLTVLQIAHKCRCSVGTVSNRLKLLHAKTGTHPAHLRNACLISGA